MANGYYTDKNGNVLGYWDLPVRPADTAEHNWVESTDRPSIYIAAKDAVKQEISTLEATITPRMTQEAAIGSALTGLGEDKSLTSAQYIAQQRARIATLRAQLT
jgi:hypothetical protein